MRWYDDEPVTAYALVRDLFCASAITCALYALHRIANGLLLGGTMKAYDRLEEAYTPEEREVLIHKIKSRSLRY